MRRRLKKWLLCQPLVLAALCLSPALATAQRDCPPPPNCPSGVVPNPYMPGIPAAPGGEGSNVPGGTETGTGAAATPGFGDLASGAGVGASASLAPPGGYIDGAIPQTMFRLRYDAERGSNRFDRAEFMYGTWREGTFHPHAFVNNGAVKGIFFDPTVRGTQILSNSVDTNTLSAYMEYAVNTRFSAFVEVPYQFTHFGTDIEDTTENANRANAAADRRFFPETEVRNPNFDPSGIGDVQAGFKYALIAEPDCRFLTLQVRAYFPTGDSNEGVGTGHFSIEPSLLFFQRLSDRLVAQGEFRYWAPIGGGPAAGDVIRYGLGLGYDVIQCPNLRVTPVAELVGWTVLGGTEAIQGTVPAPSVELRDPVSGGTTGAVLTNGTFVPDDHFFQSASGDTIVNAKIGVRTYFGKGNDIYVGYGHVLTGDRWYNEIFRVEYRHTF